MSQIWMMWLDGDTSKSMEEAIQEAMLYYQRKYGKKPNRVQIPLNSKDIYIEGILVEKDGSVQKNHLLIAADREVNGLNIETGGRGGR